MSDAITSGMVLAAGLGTRMRPLTLRCPKPLIKVSGRTMADRNVDRLVECGVEYVVLNISYLGSQIRDHFDQRKDISIEFSPEDVPLETGGGVQNALDLLEGDAFFVLNGDAVLLNGPTPALARMREKWAESDLDVLMLLHPTEKAIGYDGQGDFTLNDQAVPCFRRQETAPYVFTGVQILSRRAFVGRATGAWSLRDIYQDAIQSGRGAGLVHDGDWLHVGTPAGLDLAESYFAKNS